MFLRHGSAILRAPEGDNDGGGGGDTDPKTPAKVLTEEDIGRIANAAFTSQIKRLNLEGKITEAIGGLKLDEKFATFAEQLKASLPQAPKSDDKGDKGSKGSIDPEIQRQLAKVAEELEKERAARLAAVQEAESIKRSHEFGSARQKLYESLKPHASESLHDVWVDHLIHHKRLKVEDGTPLLEVEYAPVKGMPKQKDFLPLDEAITHLVTADEAKRFQPVPGDGDGGKGNPGPRARRGNSASSDSKDPMERVYARLEKLGINPDNEFSS